MELGLQGKHAIVTGGSRGIGKAIARELAREGANVVIAARSKAPLEAAASELSAETRRRVISISVDVTSREQVEAMVERVTGGKALPAEVVQQIVAKTDGVPLLSKS